MPELPDIELYRERLRERLVGDTLDGVRLASAFVLRTFEPKVSDCVGQRFTHISRLGKRIVLHLTGDLLLVIHLMVSGRFRFSAEPRAKIPGKLGLLALDVPKGTVIVTEASPKKRASLHILRGDSALHEMDPGGIEVLTASKEEFRARMRSENRTLKRALTDPRLLSGIGNAYSDEILFSAGMSPVTRTQSLSDEALDAVHDAIKRTLAFWTDKLRAETPGFPEKVTAFRDDFAMHGKFGKPCPSCGNPVQRIRYADNESNYCPQCQTGGKLLADRSLSRLLRGDWPKTLEELDERKAGQLPAGKSAATTGSPKTPTGSPSLRRPPRSDKTPR